MDGSKFLDGIAGIYERSIQANGSSSLGLRWEDSTAIVKFYELVHSEIKKTGLRGKRLLDFGCGYGDLWRHLTSQGESDFEYAGLDICASAVLIGRDRVPGLNLRQGSIADLHRLNPPFDITTAIGVFSPIGNAESLDDNLANLEHCLEHLCRYTRELLVFNVIRRSAGCPVVLSDNVYSYYLKDVVGILEKLSVRSFELHVCDALNKDGDYFFSVRPGLLL